MKRILRPKEVADYLAISMATLWRLNKEKDFPKKIQLSARAVGWDSSAIDMWLEKRKAI